MEGGIGDEVSCSTIAVDAVLRIGTAGVIWGSCSGPYEANKLGLSGVARASFLAKSVGRHGCQWGLFAAIFSFTRCGVQRYRGHNDWVNALVGGAVAGAAIGAGTRNWKQVAGVTGLVCALCHAAEDSRSL
ncbi:hypothetical protein M9H77_01675 [Catharanthus roseus]|uniref:Uncharacterized protein n=1 Tax=Catharanthus roseus TaxID=4058 RepID=A0ACC0C6N2_CATRO|nr:hypothetical protein M9H77_01675 [Catharanthus roseus]